jgi:hypothetical protein
MGSHDMQGVPFSVSGTVDLLALFRCISCRFKFTTDVTKPSKMVSPHVTAFDSCFSIVSRDFHAVVHAFII